MSSILQMRYFLVLAKYENLAKAANELQLSPSALSKSIGRLEDEMGIKLFDRSEKGLKLNGAGCVAQEAYMQALDILDNMYTTLGEMSNNERQQINIIAISNLSAAKIITGFKKEHPHCLLNFREASFQEIEHADMKGKYDYMIAGADFISDDDLESLLIEEYFPVLMVPKGHALAELKETTLADIAAYPLISSPANSTWGRYVDSIFRNRGLKTTTIASATYSMRSQMVASGLGISVASSNSVHLNPPSQSVEVLRIDDTFPTRNLYLYWSRSRQLTKIMKQFKRFAVEQFRSAE